MKYRSSNFVWGILLLLAAAFVLLNQFNQFTGFSNIGIGSIILAVLSVVFLLQSIANLNFQLIPIPLAVLYIVFQGPCDLPYIRPRILIIAAILALIGLSILLPKKVKNRGCGKDNSSEGHNPQMRTEDGSNDNNPVINISFGGISRRLHADSLETISLQCNFGALEIFLDQVNISPNGAEATLNCSFGAIKLFIPKHWRIIDNLHCTLGGVDTDKRFSAPEENAPQLTLNGNVSFGGIEIRYI